MRLRPTRFRSRLLAPGLLAVGLLAPLAAQAQPTPADAGGLEQQLRSWLADLLGPLVPLSERPFHITAEGDHFRVEVPIAGPVDSTGISIEGAAFALAARPLEGGRWALDSIDDVMLLRLVRDDPAATGWRSLTWSAADINYHADLDPSLAVTSTFDGSLHDYTTVEQGPDGTFTSRIGSVSSHEVWEPASSGRLNLSDSSTLEQISIEGALPAGGGRLTVTADRATRTGRLQDLAPDGIGPAIRASVQLLAPLMPTIQAAVAKPACSGEGCDQLPAAARQDKATPEQRRAAHDLVVALRDLLGGMNVQQSMETVHVVAGPYEASLAKLAIGEDVAALDGKLEARFSLALDGLDSPQIPAGIMRDYLPRHIALTPRIANVPSAAGIDLLLKVIETADASNSPELEAEAKGLLRQSPLTLGLDDVAFDFGPASLTASGEMQVPSAEPEEFTGHADIAVTGLDALIKRANTDAEVRQAAPVLLLLKGIGEQDGNAVVWHITYQDKQLLVNGNDLMQMLSGK
jgi:hypothetical protein